MIPTSEFEDYIQRLRFGIDELRRLAKFNDLSAQITLGFLLQYGLIVEGDLGEARYWYSLATNLGSPAAKYWLALSNLEAQPQTAISQLNDAAAEGYAPAQLQLSYVYHSGKLCRRDDTKGTSFAKQAADQGFLPALKYLSHLYREGIGTDQNIKEANILLQRSAEKGDASAAYELGSTILRETKDERTIIEAFEWIWKAAEHDNLAANMFLSQAYGTGMFGLHIDVRISKYFRVRADQIRAKSFKLRENASAL